MARIHGRNGRLYANLTSGGTAEPVTFLESWSITFTTDRADVTSQGDTGMVYVAGLPDVQGNYSGFYDTETVQFYTAATDGVARKFYLYPTTASTGQYWFGTALFDFNVEEGVAGAATVNGTWAAASVVAKVG